MEAMPNEYLILGGPLLWIILALGAVAVLVFLERSFHLHRSRINPDDLLDGILLNLRHGNDAEATDLCQDTPGPVAHIVAEAIRCRELPRQDMIAVLHSEGIAEISRMERRLSVLSMIAQTAPVLGLLGTVLSLLRMVQNALATAPFVQTADMLRGLMPAIITTVAGLLVAVPAYVGFHVLVVSIDRLVLDMEHAAVRIVQYLDDHRNPADPRQRTLSL